MSEVQATTELKSQYVAQVTSDLERNIKEQERISADLEVLQEQLRALQSDHAVLVALQQTLGGASTAVEADTQARPTVPSQASAEPKQRKPRKAAATSAKDTAAKPAAKTSSAKAPTAAAKPSLVDLIRGYLEREGEPRSAAEITAALTQAHPDRSIKTTVVRSTVEGLVAKSHVQRTKQGSSVFYTSAAAAEPTAAEPQPKAAAS
ncbi:hypothetical protein [Streptomyces sp. NPDC001530]|uniref:hypothetical protein n=1 Tax=Streptomyces sp. NPDC001530 TaxID=3364582 RepID=UPI0036ACF9A0